MEKFECLLHGHGEDIGDGFSLEADIEGLPVVAAAVADVAGHVYIGQEVHLDLDQPVSLARFTPPALHVEAVPARLVTAHP